MLYIFIYLFIILFILNYSFTPLCSTLQPIDVIKILNRLFTDLDTICSQEYGIEKVNNIYIHIYIFVSFFF